MNEQPKTPSAAILACNKEEKEGSLYWILSDDYAWKRYQMYFN